MTGAAPLSDPLLLTELTSPSAGQGGLRALGDLDLPGDSPQESQHFPRDGCGDDVLVLAPGTEPSVALAQPNLGLPGDVADLFRQTFQSYLDLLRHSGRMPIAPTGVFAGVQPHTGGQLPRGIETGDVAQLGGDGLLVSVQTDIQRVIPVHS